MSDRIKTPYSPTVLSEKEALSYLSRRWKEDIEIACKHRVDLVRALSIWRQSPLVESKEIGLKSLYRLKQTANSKP